MLEGSSFLMLRCERSEPRSTQSGVPSAFWIILRGPLTRAPQEERQDKPSSNGSLDAAAAFRINLRR